MADRDARKDAGGAVGGGQRHPVSQAAHELNNVIGVIRLTTELLEHEAVTPSDAAQTIRDQLSEASAVMKRLRDDLGV